jgi:hypothetical protein
MCQKPRAYRPRDPAPASSRSIGSHLAIHRLHGRAGTHACMQAGSWARPVTLTRDASVQVAAAWGWPMGCLCFTSHAVRPAGRTHHAHACPCPTLRHNGAQLDQPGVGALAAHRNRPVHGTDRHCPTPTGRRVKCTFALFLLESQA